MRNLDWNEGAPDELKVGMAIQDKDGVILLVGHINEDCGSSPDKFPDGGKTLSQTVKWAWVIQPYQLEWLESMNKQHGKGKA